MGERLPDGPQRGRPPAPQEPVASVAARRAVRDLLLSVPSYRTLDRQRQREVARAMVQVSESALALMREEAESTRLIASQRDDKSGAPRREGPVVAQALDAGQRFSGVSAQRVASTTTAILNAVSFPRFVTELINGVFKALIDTNRQQMASYVDLIKNVAAATDDFTDANLGGDRARQWLVERFPGSFEISGAGDGADGDSTDSSNDSVGAQLQIKDGASMPPEGALRTALGLEPDESVPSGDPESTLMPFARRALARQRQQVLATMVMLGMQRIVIESGRINAAMRFHIDTRSAAASDEGSMFSLANRTEASGSFGYGPWGVEAKMTNTIGYVSTQRDQTTEEMNTDLDLNSSVELYFKTDYLPLDRLAGKGAVDRIKVNTLNPDAEEKAAQAARTSREQSARQAETERGSRVDRDLTSAGRPPADTSGSTGPRPGSAARPASGNAPAASGAQRPSTSRSASPGTSGSSAGPASRDQTSTSDRRSTGGATAPGASAPSSSAAAGSERSAATALT